MATNMEKVTKALIKFGLSDVNGIAEVTKISKPAIYKLAAQNNASFTLNNGIMILKDEHKAMSDAKDGTVNKECDKLHVPDYMFLMDGTFFADLERDVYVEHVSDHLKHMLEVGNMVGLNTQEINAVTIMLIKELKLRYENTKG